MSKVKYLKQITDKNGTRAEAIKGMPTQKKCDPATSFLGLANYYGVYIPNVHNLRAPLNNLNKGVKCK